MRLRKLSPMTSISSQTIPSPSIVGCTPGGAPHGVTWEEIDAEPPSLDSPQSGKRGTSHPRYAREVGGAAVSLRLGRLARITDIRRSHFGKAPMSGVK